MPDYLGDDQRKTKEEDKEDAPIRGKILSNLQNQRICKGKSVVSRLAYVNPVLQKNDYKLWLGVFLNLTDTPPFGHV